MNTSTESAEQLIESIKTLPPESLTELSTFVRYLKFKTDETSKMSGKDFLLSIAGIGASGETDVSERAEEILSEEIDPIRGWSAKTNGTT